MVGRGGGNWIGVECQECRGTGLAEPPAPPPRYDARGYKIPEDGEEYDESVHGPVSASPLTLASVCRVCFGAGVVLEQDGGRSPCPACSANEEA